MKNFLLWCMVISMLIVVGFTMMFPVIISIVTSNWWYLFLYFPIWIPVTIEIFIFDLILELFD